MSKQTYQFKHEDGKWIVYLYGSDYAVAQFDNYVDAVNKTIEHGNHVYKNIRIVDEYDGVIYEN